MFNLPPSRTFTISMVGIAGLWIYGLVLLVALCLVLKNAPGSTETVQALIGLLTTIVLAVGGCTGVGAGGMVARDVASRGTTTSGAQNEAAKENGP